MVRLLTILIILLSPTMVLAVTPKELREMLNEEKREHIRDQNKTKTDDPSKLLKYPDTTVESDTPGNSKENQSITNTNNSQSTTTTNTTGNNQNKEDSSPRITKHSNPSSPLNTINSNENHTNTTHRNNLPSKTNYRKTNNLLVPPRLGGGNAKPSQDVVTADTTRFCIRMGTWMKAELRRNVTSADPDDMSIFLLNDVVGECQTLPAGTELFGAKSFNSGTKKLDSTLTYGITPDGKEFRFSATVYDVNKRAGLNGTVIRNRSEEVKTATQNSLLNVSRAAISTITGSPITEGVSDVGQELLKNEQQQVKQQQYIIDVPPQIVLIKIKRTF